MHYFYAIITANEYHKKRRQIFELIFVPAFAFLPSLIYAVELFIKGTEHINYSDVSSSILFALIYECLALSLLYYVLYKRDESFSNLGLNFTWKQLFAGIVLAIGIYVFIYAFEWILIRALPPTYVKYLHPKNTDFLQTNFSLLFFGFLLINAFTEETIVRGFIIKEMFALTNNKTLAIIISVLFQMSYHLYQGLLPALIVGLVFLIYSIYYVKTGSLTPVIIAHILMDIIAISTIKHR